MAGVNDDSGVYPFGRFLRKDPPCPVRRVVLLASFLLFCGGVSAHDKDARAQVSSSMPDALIGVWHRNNEEGREACEAYKKIESASDIDERTSGLVGGLMITRHLMHAYSDYGEGDFHVTKRVVELGNQNWEVDALIGTDSMPNEGADAYQETIRFAVASGLLTMNEADSAGGITHASRFFRCGEVLDGMYPDQSDATQ